MGAVQSLVAAEVDKKKAETAAIAQRAAADAQRATEEAKRAAADAAAVTQRAAAEAATQQLLQAKLQAEKLKVDAEALMAKASGFRRKAFTYGALGLVGVGAAAVIGLAADYAYHESDYFIKRRMRQQLLSYAPPANAAPPPSKRLSVTQLPLVPVSKLSE